MGSPAASARPARPPKPDCSSVAREPRTAGTSIPPCRATYARQPERRPVKRSTLPGRARTLAPCGTGHAPRSARSSTAPRSAPATAKRSGARKARAGPVIVHSSAAAPAGLPTARLATAWARASIGPAPLTPTRRYPARPASCTVVSRPGSSTSTTGVAGGVGTADAGSGGGSSATGTEAHAVAGGEEGRLRAEGVEEAQRGPPDEPPAAGGGDGVDAGLPPRDGHRSRRDADAGRGAARGLEGLRQEPEVGEPGREAEHEHGVRPARVQPDEVRLGQAALARERGEVGPALSAVHHRHLVKPAGGGRGPTARGAGDEAARQGAEPGGGRVEEDEQGAVAGHRLAEALERGEGQVPVEGEDTRVRRGRRARLPARR